MHLRLRAPPFLIAGLLACACTAAPRPTPTDAVPARHASALRASAEATDAEALHDALAQAWTGPALTARFRAEEAARQSRDATSGRLALDEVASERAVLLSGGPDRATVELHWRIRGSVTHGGHTHPRHLRAASRVDAIWTPDGWRIQRDQPLEVLALP